MLSHKKTMVKQLQNVCSFLNFIGRCILPGRAFTRRLYMQLQNTQHLKQHHHLRITQEMRDDLTMWKEFIDHPSIYCRGFMDFSKTWEAAEICMYSDASKNPNLGFSGICGDSWMYKQWDPSFIMRDDPSIEYLELYAVLTTTLNWLHRFKNKRIILFCDNQSVVYMINNMTSSCKNCLCLIRKLVLHGLCLNTRVFAKHVTSRANKKSDLLSRLRIEQFKKISPHAELLPTKVPDVLWPMSKIWLK